MSIFRRRPLALICAVFILAALIGFFIDAKLKYAATVILTVAALLAAYLFSGKKIDMRSFRLTLAAIIAALLALLSSYLYFDVLYMSAQSYIGEERTISGVVTERRYSNSFSTGYGVRINQIDGRPARYKAILDCEFVSDLQPGFAFTAAVTPEALGYSDYDKSDKLYAISGGYVLRCVAASEDDCQIGGEDNFILSVWLRGLNRRVTSLLTREVGGEEGRLAAALSLGRQDLLSDATARDFRRTGISHMLALSGVNLTVLMGAVDFLLRKLSIPRWARCAMLISFTISFLALTGFSPSLTRAALMLMMVYLSYFFASEPDPLTSLFVACSLILLLSPPSVADAGLWLSFFAALGIIVGVAASRGAILFLKRIRSGRERGVVGAARAAASKSFVYITSACVTTLSASLAVSLCSWLYFGEMSALTILTNICLGPLSSLILVLALLLIALSGIPAAAGILAGPTRLVSGIMLDLAGYFSQSGFAVVSLRYAFAGVIIMLMTAAYIVLAVVRLKRKAHMALPAGAAALALALCLGIFSAANSGMVKITYINNKSGELLLLSSPGGALLCDISDGSKSGIRRAIAAADDENVTEFEVYLLTHYHQKHISSTDKLLGVEVVRQLWLPEPVDEREFGVMQSLIAVAKKHNCPTVIYERGGELTIFGSSRLLVNTAYINRSTHPVIFLSLECGGEHFTYAGASYSESPLAADAAHALGKSNNIVFGSHGPVTKTHFSCAPLPETPQNIIFADDTVLSHFSPDPKELSALESATLIRAPGRRVFVYSK